MPALLDPRRTVAAVVAVAMSAALITFALIVSDSFRSQLTADARASVGEADAVVLVDPRDTTADGRLSGQAVQEASQADGAAAVRLYTEGNVSVRHHGGLSDTSAIVLDVPEPTGGTELVQGRLPERTGEIAVSPSFLQHEEELGAGTGTTVGSTITLASGDPDSEQTSTATTSTATIVGVVQPGAEITRNDPNGISHIFATAEEQAELGLSQDPAVLYVTAQPGTSAGELVATLTRAVTAVQPGVEVYTASDIITMRAQNAGATSSNALNLLQLITPVCAVVAGIVIATTFTTLVARQTRQVGLLRCVGATRRQVLASVLRTATLTGLAGSVAGAAAGTGLAALVINSGVIEGVGTGHLTVSWRSLALAVLIGTVVTLVSVLRPAYQATRVSPLVALTGEAAGSGSPRRRRRLATVSGAAVIVLGLGLLWGGATWRALQVLVTGAVVVVLGVMVLLPTLVTRVSRLAEALSGGPRRPVLQLATRNLARNPRRSAATAASLLVCVAVAAAMATGVSVFTASWGSYVTSRSPVDIIVGDLATDQDAEAVTAQVQAVEGVETAVAVPSLDVQMTSASAEVDEDVDDQTVTVIATDQEAVSPVLRSLEVLEDLDDHTLVLESVYEIPDGTQVTLTGPEGSADLTVRVNPGASEALVTPAVAKQLAGDAPTASTLWVRASGEITDQAPAAAVREALEGTGLYVADFMESRSGLTDEVVQVAAAVGAMLVFTLLIALSGMASTTSMSVLERTREIGVLRATGTQRAEVRSLFVSEGVLTALLGGGIGLVLGCGVGVAGAAALLNNGEGSPLSVPVWLAPGLLIILLAAAAVGVLASLRPAGAASRVPPVQALAVD
ncbi:ABC transporter permease [Actinomyces lilanjuaniae]|uniref:ABC transporter permease n=1 Tax=Actinomyces lilanjuaniae TaxID=2321394 RepID=A0ABM6Z1S7_9ACTO|nr:FtsX-like permease family protein [Actinomyces lilanjuaniae]AYD89231.1 ABC transporter permease [Actinomyces lilanjuaniae]